MPRTERKPPTTKPPNLVWLTLETLIGGSQPGSPTLQVGGVSFGAVQSAKPTDGANKITVANKLKVK